MRRSNNYVSQTPTQNNYSKTQNDKKQSHMVMNNFLGNQEINTRNTKAVSSMISKNLVFSPTNLSQLSQTANSSGIRERRTHSIAGFTKDMNAQVPGHHSQFE